MSAMKISVIVPTRKRPEMLRSALLSIQNQSRQDLIAEVLVSENSEDGRSEELCRTFPNLPIRFFRQQPARSLAGHFQWLVENASSEWVAWLADDDMWGRYHLEEAARLLVQNPGAVACAGECATIFNDSRAAIEGMRETVYSLVGDTPTSYKTCWLWSREDMLLNILVHTPLNMWAIVFRKPALLNAIEALVPSDAGYESDRLFLWRLVLEGPIVVSREISMFSRIHENNTWAELWRQDKDKQQRLTRQYVNAIIDQAESLGIQAKSLWLEAWCSLDDAIKKRILKKNGKAAIDEIRQRWGDEAVRVEVDKPTTKNWPKVLQDWVPPILWRIAGSLRNLWGSQQRAAAKQ
jgi:glycosyltransferase involved in cell wall biosynthesis